jgi:hypothetical protein
MQPVPVPMDAKGIRKIPDRAARVVWKVESKQSDGVPIGPIIIDDRRLEGRLFTQYEAQSLARFLGANFGV